MYWRNVPNPKPARFRTLPLIHRLVFGYTLAAFITLSAAGVFLYQGLWHSFMVEDAELLSDHLNTVRDRVTAGHGNLEEARDLVLHATRGHKLERYYGRLEDARGRILAETPGFTNIAGPDHFPPPVPAHANIPNLVPRRSLSGVIIAQTAGLIKSGGAEPQMLRYRLVFDASHVQAQTSQYRRQLILVVIAGTAFSALMGGLITRQVLQPLRDITAAVQNVTVRGLHDEVGSQLWPRELSALADEFDKMLARLRESFMRLSQFSADAAHEFRTPLNNLMISTSLTLSRERPAEEYRAGLTANLDQFDRLKRLLDSLLFLARAENAEAVVSYTDLRVAELAGGVLDFFSALAEEQGVNLVMRGDYILRADETLLRMAITNLVSNALRYTPPGGMITVEAVGDSHNCVITVRDTGAGIAPEHLPYLFNRFYRVDPARSSVENAGAGLGLAIVQTIVNLHRGALSVDSTLGTGTSFQLRLPVRNA